MKLKLRISMGRRTTWSAVGSHINSVIEDPPLLLWSLYILTSPIYIFKSGLPQPSDFLILILMPMALINWNGKMSRPLIHSVRALIWFTAYVVGNAVLWSLASGHITFDAHYGFLMAPLFYIFDSLVFICAIVMYRRHRERFLWVTVRLVLISLVLQMIVSFFYTRGDHSATRMAGLFNSPNQLGNFAVLSCSIVLLGQRRVGITTTQSGLAQLAMCYLALISASKAALVCCALLVMVGVIDRLRAVLLIAAVACFFLFVTNPFAAAIERSQKRIESDQSLGFFEERGYDRMVHHSQYLVLGAGEGGYNRFLETSKIGSHELHSSAGTLIFCYGVVGAGLFLIFIWKVCRGGDLRRWLLLVPPASFGLSHQGIRDTMFWVVLAVVALLNDLDYYDRTTARAGAPTKAMT